VNILVIADSNGRSWGVLHPIPKTWVVYSFPGAKLHDADRLLHTHKDVLNFVSKTVVCVGVNDRTESTAATLAKIRSIDSWANRANKAALFMGIPPFPNLPREEQENIDRINTQARDVFGDKYVHPIEQECWE